MVKKYKKMKQAHGWMDGELMETWWVFTSTGARVFTSTGAIIIIIKKECQIATRQEMRPTCEWDAVVVVLFYCAREELLG